MRWVLLVVFVFLTVGCAAADVGNDELSTSPQAASAAPTAAPTPTATAAPSPTAELGPNVVASLLMQACEVVDDGVVEDLAQSQIAAASVSLDSGLAFCRYGMANSVTVQVASAPAADWADTMPGAISALENSVLFELPDNREKLALANALMNAGGDDASQGACQLFSLLVELQGLAPGLDQVVNLIPDPSNPVGINAQRCADGVYSLVELETGDSFDRIETTTRLLTALDAVHAAGVDR